MPVDGYTQRMLFDQFRYRGLHGCDSVCRLELIRLTDSRTVAIATVLPENPGTSVTNVAEHLASAICDKFAIEPGKLVWIEHYACNDSARTKSERTYHLVTFTRRPLEPVKWSATVLRYQPDGWPGCFIEPRWRPMNNVDWQALGMQFLGK